MKDNDSNGKLSSSLTLIARLSINKRTTSVKEILAFHLAHLDDDNCRELAQDIIDGNLKNPAAKRYIDWALKTRDGAGDSERKRKQIVAMCAVESFYYLDKEVKRLHDIGATHRKRGIKLNERSPFAVAQHLVEESKELSYEVQVEREAAGLEEAADVMLVFLHLLQLQDWTINDVVERAFEKLKDIFPDGYESPETTVS